MIDFTEISEDGELWEMFARDFLQETGFFVESSPDRGPDGGKDLLVTEELTGNLGKYKFRWLVSCKHFAKSNKAVSEQHEPNIVERVESFTSDGFIGFYSTLPTSGLNTRLKSLKSNGKIKDYRIFDKQLIENYLLRIGYSQILLMYFPESYQVVHPLNLMVDEYIPLNCAKCGKDLLKSFYEKNEVGNLAFVIEHQDSVLYVKDIYWACRKTCDPVMEKYYWNNFKLATKWLDLSDLAIPSVFLTSVFSWMNRIREGKLVFTDEAYEKLKDFMLAMSQKVFREMTVREQKQAKDLIDISLFR